MIRETNWLRRRTLLHTMAGTAALSVACLGLTGMASAQDGIVIGQSLPTLNNPWYVAFSEGSQDMADALGIELILVTNPATTPFDPSAQINVIENLIARRPNVIQVDPTSSDAINFAIDRSREEGIPVVTDGIYVTTEVDAAVVADNRQGGELAGRYLAQLLADGGEVAMLEGTPGRDIITQRHEGFKAGLSENAAVQIVASQNANLDRSQGQTVTENILQANADLDAIWGASDTMALGALEALRSRDLAGDVVLGGFDGTPEAFEAIEAGDMSFTIDQVPYEMGATAIALAYLIATGEQPASEVILDTTLVDQSNVAQYLDDATGRREAALASIIEAYGLSTAQ